MRVPAWSKPRRILTTAVVGALTVGVLSPAASATTPDPVQRGVNSLVDAGGVPAALASVQDNAGRMRAYAAGVGDLATRARVPRDGQVRVGSNTKAFTAVVVLQLVAEGKVDLDSPIERYLPGLVHGDGIDGGAIKVRQLLQHTSGLPNYTRYLEEVRYYEPRDLLDLALAHPADFPPGTSWAYSNTNYLLAGLLIQKITGHPVAREIEERVIRRIGLRHTYLPTPGEEGIREAHPKGYDRDSPVAPLRDVTEMDSSWAWAAGQIVSTNADLNRFYTALLHHELLPDAQLAQMRTTVDAGYFGPGARYGLGLVSFPLSCGVVLWGHGGSLPGYETRGGATEDGRAFNVAVTLQATDDPAKQRLAAVVDAALCP